MREEEQIQHSSTGHETRDAEIRPVVFTGIGLAVVLAVIGLIGYCMFRFLTTNTAIDVRENPMAAGASQVPPTPRLEEHPALEIRQLHAQEERTLSSYGWADKKAGRVRIPIDRAMELYLQRGFPRPKETTRK
jgi:hypothetical protein